MFIITASVAWGYWAGSNDYSRYEFAMGQAAIVLLGVFSYLQLGFVV